MFAAMLQVVPGCPLLIFANRDEARTRSWQPPELRRNTDDGLVWLGGLDLAAGGTWLGLNERGLIVGMTNRPKSRVGADVRSRGLLCRDLLGRPSVDAALAELGRQLGRYRFAGFNVLILSPDKSVVVEMGDEPRTIPLDAGLHVVANRSLNDASDPRVYRARQQAENRMAGVANSKAAIRFARTICGLPADGECVALCIDGQEWGTVSSTIIALDSAGQRVDYLFAPGSPSTTPYDDYSELATTLFTP